MIDRDAASAEAEDLLRKTLAARRKSLGQEHPDTLINALALVRVMVQRGGDVGEGEAKRIVGVLLPSMTRVFGLEHTETMEANRLSVRLGNA